MAGESGGRGEWLGAPAHRLLALLAGGIAVTVLAGWLFGIPVFRSFHAGYVSMKPNIAVCLLLVSWALWMLDRDGGSPAARPAFTACLAIVFLVSIATIAEDLLVRDFGIDQIMFREPAGEPGTSIPGRPAIGGMVCLLGASISLGLLTSARLVPAAQWVALVPAMIAYRSFVGYLLGVREFYAFGSFTDMALPGSIAFLLLSGGLLLARPDRGFMAVVTGPGAGGLLMRRLAPAVILLLIVLDWLREVGEAAHLYSSPYGASLTILVSTILLTGATYLAARQLDRADRERTEAMLQLRNALDRLRSAQEKMVEQARLRAMGEMASGIAHDLNNHLVPILGFTETMLEWPATLRNRKEAAEMLGSIRDAATDAADMVARLRRFYRPAGEVDVLGAHDLNQLVADTIVLTRPRWRARPDGRTIAVTAEPGAVRPVTCNADEIREVLVNLVLNAVDALPNGGAIHLRTREEGSECVVEVLDDGIGMTDEVRRRCCEPFFTTKGEGGTGLGLAMVSSIVRRRNGSVAVESAPGRGTTVTIRLPLGTADGVSAKPAPAVPWKTSLRVLVADDEPRVRRLLAGQLRRDGHRVTATADGLAALDAFKARRFDLVITDRVMPGMGGDELADAVKRLKPACPVIMVTALESPPDGADAARAPADMILRKPFSLSDLRGAIARVMSRRQA